MKTLRKPASEMAQNIGLDFTHRYDIIPELSRCSLHVPENTGEGIQKDSRSVENFQEAEMTASEIKKLHTKARECRMWAGEMAAKASYAAEDDNVEEYQKCMAEVGRLALLGAKLVKEARAAAQALA